MLKRKQYEAIRLLADGTLRQGDIAKLIGVNHSTLCRWKKDPEFLLEYGRQVKEQITTQAPGSYKALVHFLKARSEAEYAETSLAAAAILERVEEEEKESYRKAVAGH